eukprot:gnl/TRDRNA2_/TRDRNA2_170479_c4_seq1.p1 gnl/TRDRNA2_/TRDRNA2_170479_c4~~gnl/TRDRNA2_/TRDRNA2_170479_c4_seq1.p1  ORF type:complete len:413 (+),score=69.10 gnl/TRDRNA2_/TRDRNA2_170479_c4_seq1:102-1241(+)
MEPVHQAALRASGGAVRSSEQIRTTQKWKDLSAFFLNSSYDEEGNRLLHIAVETAKRGKDPPGQVCRALLAAKADPTLRRDNGDMALHIAAEAGLVGIYQMLRDAISLQLDASQLEELELNDTAGHTKRTPHTLLRQSNIRQKLVAHEVARDERPFWLRVGFMAFHHAFLLARLEMEDENEAPPLMSRYRECSRESLKRLLGECGIDEDAASLAAQVKEKLEHLENAGAAADAQGSTSPQHFDGIFDQASLESLPASPFAFSRRTSPDGDLISIVSASYAPSREPSKVSQARSKTNQVKFAKEAEKQANREPAFKHQQRLHMMPTAQKAQATLHLLPTVQKIQAPKSPPEPQASGRSSQQGSARRPSLPKVTTRTPTGK